MPAILPREARGLWREFLAQCEKDCVPASVCLVAALLDWTSHTDEPMHGVESWKGVGYQHAIEYLAEQRREGAGSGEGNGEARQGENGVDAGEAQASGSLAPAFRMPEVLPREAAELWERLIETCRIDRVPIGLGLAAALRDYVSLDFNGCNWEHAAGNGGRGESLVYASEYLAARQAKAQFGPATDTADESNEPEDDRGAGDSQPQQVEEAEARA